MLKMYVIGVVTGSFDFLNIEYKVTYMHPTLTSVFCVNLG